VQILESQKGWHDEKKNQFALFVFPPVFYAVTPFLRFWTTEERRDLRIRPGSPVRRLDVRYPLTRAWCPSEWIYDRLFRGKGFDNLVWLATKYETKDGKGWIIHLRKGVKFHNGREMTAEDVKINFDWRIRTPKGWPPVMNKEYIRYLNRVEVVDKYTIRIVLDHPFSSLMPVLAYAVRGISPPEEVEKWQDKFLIHPLGQALQGGENQTPDRVIERFDGY
jgi:ABC-type transport system substrate-binding protein